MLTTPITAADLALALLALDALDAEATTLRDCDAFAAWCDELRQRVRVANAAPHRHRFPLAARFTAMSGLSATRSRSRAKSSGACSRSQSRAR